MEETQGMCRAMGRQDMTQMRLSFPHTRHPGVLFLAMILEEEYLPFHVFSHDLKITITIVTIVHNHNCYLLLTDQQQDELVSESQITIVIVNT